MSPSRYLAPLLALCLSACSEMGYYAQATRGQLQILSAREDITDIVSNPDTPAELRMRLELVQSIRQFAIDELSLPNSGSYESYAQTGRDYVVWNVLAAPAYDISLKTWCFPVAGCVAYKGFFTEQSARDLEQGLADQGYDTFLYGVSAYSTLGWFNDPVLDTFINYPDTALAGLLIHEIAHQVVYVKDDSAFNEAFATAVEQAGLELWIQRTLSAADATRYREQKLRQNRITDMVLEFRNQLATSYGKTAESRQEQKKRDQFSTLKSRYAELQTQGLGTPYYDWWFKQDLNNAHLASISTYHQLVPAFSRALEQAGSFSAFYDLVRDKAVLPEFERNAWLSELQRE